VIVTCAHLNQSLTQSDIAPLLRKSQYQGNIESVASIPDRVRRLIADSGLTNQDFAAKIGLDAPKLSKSLSGARRFTSVDLAEIADLCGTTVDWLVTGDEPRVAIAARTTGGTAGNALAAAATYSTMRTDLVRIGYAQLWQTVSADISRCGYIEGGRRLAAQALARVEEADRSVSADDLPDLVERLFGIDVAIIGLDEDFDGLAVSTDDAKLIVLATSRLPSRQRFTVAHELGHLLAGDDHGVHLDEDIFSPAQRKDPGELRANAFAAAFLMPEPELRAAGAGISEASFAELACHLGVSPQPLAYRMRELRVIDGGLCDRFSAITAQQAAKIAGCGTEFAQRIVTANTPRPPGLLVRDTYVAYEAGQITLRPYADLLDRDVDQLIDELDADQGHSETL